MNTFDAAILGGGPAGLATALAARARGLSVLLVERSDFDGVRVGEHLGADALPALTLLEVPPSTWRDGHLACSSVRSTWGDDVEQEAHALFNPFGEGRILSRPRFDRALALFAEARGVVIARSTELLRSARDPNGFVLTLAPRGESGDKASTTSMKAAFLVDAGGRSASAARWLGGRPIAYDRLAGLVTFLDAPAGERDRSVRVEACKEGYWYSAPLLDGRRVLTLMTDADLISNPPSVFFHRAIRESRWALAGANAPPRLIVRSARSQRLTVTGGEGWLAVGDAAMAFDPLSSAGIRKGLTWGIRAAEAMEAYLGGDTGATARYDGEVHAAFDAYLDQKAHYYRMERRWPASPFWARRHAPMPCEIPITLDPSARVHLPSDGAESAFARIAVEMPQIDLDSLRAIAKEPVRACEAVARYQALCGGRILDRDVIVALQRVAA